MNANAILFLAIIFAALPQYTASSSTEMDAKTVQCEKLSGLFCDARVGCALSHGTCHSVRSSEPADLNCSQILHEVSDSVCYLFAHEHGIECASQAETAVHEAQFNLLQALKALTATNWGVMLSGQQGLLPWPGSVSQP